MARKRTMAGQVVSQRIPREKTSLIIPTAHYGNIAGRMDPSNGPNKPTLERIYDMKLETIITLALIALIAYGIYIVTAGMM